MALPNRSTSGFPSKYTIRSSDCGTKVPPEAGWPWKREAASCNNVYLDSASTCSHCVRHEIAALTFLLAHETNSQICYGARSRPKYADISGLAEIDRFKTFLTRISIFKFCALAGRRNALFYFSGKRCKKAQQMQSYPACRYLSELESYINLKFGLQNILLSDEKLSRECISVKRTTNRARGQLPAHFGVRLRTLNS